ncbi:hypothetical protein GALMADRAFT_1129421 [Galerina marginata CBS 339.88]|uniref:Uncharacterized protein n=1 Tax=Galerina marginata (strain CBS 339.88) TaxID=685588 RepID=A0A067S8B6_GALM3|nr:hypothetical protein GALMADRAFT_1129421 [Galerina marginata CBS 339.88]
MFRNFYVQFDMQDTVSLSPPPPPSSSPPPQSPSLVSSPSSLSLLLPLASSSHGPECPPPPKKRRISQDQRIALSAQFENSFDTIQVAGKRKRHSQS